MREQAGHLVCWSAWIKIKNGVLD